MNKKKFPKGINEVSQRVIKAAEHSEPVVIFGDSDLDGISSVVILQELFEFLNPLYGGKNLSVYFSNREIEGYGLSFSVLESIKDRAPALLFILDAGISNFEEIKKAKKMGFEVIVIDHHQILKKLPKADLIVDPKQKEESYPFKYFAAAGLVYKLAQRVLEEKKHPDFLEDRLSELAALATIADMVPIEEDNEEIINQGLEALTSTQRTGILALIQLNDIDINSDQDISQKIIAPLNTFKIKDHVAESYTLLTESSFPKAKKLAQKLIRQTKEKKRAIKMFVNELKEEVEKRDSKKSVIFKYSKAWNAVYLGIIASKLLNFSKKPVFVCRQGENKECVCSARLPKPLDGVKAMEACKKHLITYGGHAPACGCRVKEEDLDKFGKCLEKYFKQLKIEINDEQ